MKNILARGGIEFLAVFLGIALSLYVDEWREENQIREPVSYTHLTLPTIYSV